MTLKEAAAGGQTIFEYSPSSAGSFDYQNFAEELIRDHHKTVEKRRFYQRQFEQLSPEDQQQILMFARENLSNYIKNRLDHIDENAVIEEALLIERNKIIERFYPYRTGLPVEEQP